MLYKGIHLSIVVIGIMVSICAHVPMSLRARTSVPDDRSEIKATEKGCGSDSSEMLTGILGDELI